MGGLEDIQGMRDVPEQQFFRLHDSGVIKNLYELYTMLQEMDPKVFYHHVNSEKNDFSNWVRSVHQDPILAEELQPAMSITTCADAVSKRLYEMETSGICFFSVPVGC